MVSGSILKLPVFHNHFDNCWRKAPCYQTVAMVTVQKIFLTNLSFFETLKGISNTLQNLTFVQLSVDEIVGGGSDNSTWHKVGSEIAWYEKG